MEVPMSAKTTAQARNGPRRPDDFLRSNSLSGISAKAREADRRPWVWVWRGVATRDGGVAAMSLTDDDVDRLGELGKQLLEDVPAQELPDRRAGGGPHQHAGDAQLLGRLGERRAGVV